MDNEKIEKETLEPAAPQEKAPSFDIDSSATEVVELYLDDIIPNRFQPRERFDENALKELAASIKEHGVIQPIIVRKIGDKYEIIAGERRYKASAIAGLTKIPAIIRNLDDKESSKVALLENLQRKNLSAIEEARTYQKILDLDQMTQFELAKTMGKSQPAVANKLRLLSLPDEVQDALLKEQISERHARSLLNVENEQEQIDLLHKIINNRMTVRELDEEIKGKNNPLQGLSASNDIPSLNLEQHSAPAPETPTIVSESPVKPVEEPSNDFDKLNNINATGNTTPTPEGAPLADLDQLLKMANKPQKINESSFIPKEPEKEEISPVNNIDSLENAQPSPISPTPEFVSDPKLEPEPEVLAEPTQEVLDEKVEQLEPTPTPRSKKEAVEKIDSIVNEFKNSGLDVNVEKMDFGTTYQIIIRINGED